MARLAMITLAVPSYDAALRFFTAVGFVVAEDTAMSADKRWVVVRPADGGSDLLLAQATGDRQLSRVGDQTGGRVAFFLHTADLDVELARWKSAGAAAEEEPRPEAYGRVCVVRDPWGNRWDLVHTNG